MTEDKDIKQYKKIRKRIGTCVLVLFVFCALLNPGGPCGPPLLVARRAVCYNTPR